MRRGALLLVDHARPEALGTLVRGLATAFPEIEVHTTAAEVLRAPEGSTIIWYPDVRDCERANLERPVFADRALKVILFSPKRVSDEYARRAPDFFSWITRYVECPPLPWVPAVRGLQLAAGCTEALGIRWTRGDLDAAFTSAFPGVSLVRCSAGLAYDEMVKLCAENRAWISWLDVDGPYRLRRLVWAAAEARRSGRLLLERPTVASPGFWPVSGQRMFVAQARELLRKAGAIRPGRLAALLDFEPESLRLAAAWLRVGGSSADIEARAQAAEDGGAEAARMALERGVAHRRPAPPILRAEGCALLWVPEDRVRDKLSGTPQDRGSWAALSEDALDAGDPRIALFWAQRSVTDDSSFADGQIAVSRALFARGQSREAIAFLERLVGDAPVSALGPESQKARAMLAAFRARLKMSTPGDVAYMKELLEGMRSRGPRTWQFVQVLQTVGLLRSQAGDSAAAFQALEEALRIEKSLRGSERQKILTSRHGLAMILRARGALREAEGMARHALEDTRNLLGDEHPHTATCLQGLGSVLAAKGDTRGAIKHLEKALSLKQRLYGDEHLSTAATCHELGKVYSAVGDLDRAEALLESARACRRDALGDESPDLAETLDALGRLKQEQGLHAEAEALLRQATEIRARALGTAHPETLESVQGLSQVAGENSDRRAPINEFLEDLPKRPVPGFRPWPFVDPMQQLYAIRRLLHFPQRLAAIQRDGGARGVAARAARWFFFKPLALLIDRLDRLEERLGPDRDHRAATLRALGAVYLATTARAASWANCDALSRVAIERVRATFGRDHPFTRDVEEALLEPTVSLG